MFTGVGQAMDLLIMIFFLPIQVAARGADREGCVEVDQNVGFGDFLPHRLYVRMFLRDMTAEISIIFKPCHQRRLTRTAGSNNTNNRSITWRLHKNFLVTTSVVTK